MVKLATEAALERLNNWLRRHLINPVERKSRAHKSLMTYVLAQAEMHRRTTGGYTQQLAHQSSLRDGGAHKFLMSCVAVQAETHRKTTDGEAAMEAEMQKSNNWPIGSFVEHIHRKKQGT